MLNLIKQLTQQHIVDKRYLDETQTPRPLFLKTAENHTISAYDGSSHLLLTFSIPPDTTEAESQNNPYARTEIAVSALQEALIQETKKLGYTALNLGPSLVIIDEEEGGITITVAFADCTLYITALDIAL